MRSIAYHEEALYGDYRDTLDFPKPPFRSFTYDGRKEELEWYITDNWEDENESIENMVARLNKKLYCLLEREMPGDKWGEMLPIERYYDAQQYSITKEDMPMVREIVKRLREEAKVWQARWR